MSRECCRRTFRGCLRIPGCRGVCYKCVLPVCYSGNESDEEKDDKDEGYASYGGLPSERQSPVCEHSKKGSSDIVDDHVTIAVYENDDVVTVGTDLRCSSVDKLYIPLGKPASTNDDDHTCVVTSSSHSDYVNAPRKNENDLLLNDRTDFTSGEATTSGYVNTESSVTCDIHSEICAQQNIQEPINNQKTCQSTQYECNIKSKDIVEFRNNDELNSQTDMYIPATRRSIVDSPTKRQTLILLETDL